MGLSISSSYSTPYQIISKVSEFVRGTKRKLSERDTEDNMDKIIDIAMHTPKRKKVETTAQYIYQALFKEGKNSDVKVSALGVDFMLHKIYLCQSPYFASMFGGSWLESEKTFINIDVVDPAITKESLNTVFGSLYCDEIMLNPIEVIPILATATMFQLDGIIDKCREVMIETINSKTALDYYSAACQYGDTKLKERSIKWFLVNLMGYFYNLSHLDQLGTIPIDLMSLLVLHPDLCVMKTEITLYVLLTQWMYVQLHPDEEYSSQEITNFYGSRKDDVPYLLTEEAHPYISVFQNLRLQHLITHHMDVELLLRENVIPKGWIQNVVMQQWKLTLKVNQNEEKGPAEISRESFLSYSLRCGRTLEVREKHMWRWTGFHYGVDLIMMADDRSLSIKRNHRPEYEQLLSLQTVRHIAIRVTVYTLNEQRQIVYSQCSGIKYLSLSKSEETTLLTFDQINFPLVISANVLFVTPEEVENVENVLTVT
ncbi:protein germ cell-less [Onthophagus taurus]|uniref:protein germ cell-less n=1 Tax=Onthophagus taurus TaxID=166361 RepID=UPI000C20FB0B|nr:protein germ cell-less [Onthophagus taurus]